MKRIFLLKNIIYLMIIIISEIFMVCAICNGQGTGTGKDADQVYNKWKAIGRTAANASFSIIKNAGAKPQMGDIIVLTNAGYAEVNGASTQGAIDGLTEITGASRGNNTLVEIHSSPWTSLWFALYDKKSGLCSYTEFGASPDENTSSSGLSVTNSLERIDFDYLSSHADEYKVKFDNKVFGGNEFRIISIVNAIAEGVPPYAVRAFEFHDHYCPGVTSGIMMACWLKRHFPPVSGSDYFVQAIQPWCKEDALMVLLNTTPGKKSYSITYPTDADLERLLPEAKDASTVVYRKKKGSENWEGIILSFKWATATQCPDTGNGIVDKVCTDLWYLKHMERPEDFVYIVKFFELPQGVSPKDWSAPGVNPLEKIGLING